MIYRSTYKESLGEFISLSLTEHEKNIKYNVIWKR